MGNEMFNEEQLAEAAEMEKARDRARLASRLVVAEREIEGAHRLLTQFGVPEQMPPFKAPLAPLSYRLRRLNALRDQEVYLAARAESSHRNDTDMLRAEIGALSRRVAELTVALRPLAALAPAYGDLGLDGAAIITVQVPAAESQRNVQLLPDHALAAAAALADPGEGPAGECQLSCPPEWTGHWRDWHAIDHDCATKGRR